MHLTLDMYAGHIARGDVKATYHPTLPFVVVNYSRETQANGAWTPLTRAARGLVFETESGEGQLVARPFPKFFNLGEPEQMALPPGEPDFISYKLDGSLAIGFKYKGKVYWTTRGSMSSNEAAIAQRVWDRDYGDTGNADWPTGWTVLAEVMSPDIKSVVPSNTDKLVTIGAIQTETGRDLGAIRGMGYHPVVKYMRRTPLFMGPLAQARDLVLNMGSDQEGLVAGWCLDDGTVTRVKFKSDAYLRAHRALSHTSDLQLAELWYFNEPLPEALPEEYVMYAKDLWAKLDEAVANDDDEARDMAWAHESIQDLHHWEGYHRLFPLAALLLKAPNPDKYTALGRKLAFKHIIGRAPRQRQGRES